jgi:hypothetical protein
MATSVYIAVQFRVKATVKNTNHYKLEQVEQLHVWEKEAIL